MSKDELLEALRFGADVIFRSKDQQITDEDIDLILERGACGVALAPVYIDIWCPVCLYGSVCMVLRLIRPPTTNHPKPGRKRTAEITEKLQAADKGDLLDFRMDGGMSAQVFEGQDYSKGRNKVGLWLRGCGLRRAGLSRPSLNEGICG